MRRADRAVAGGFLLGFLVAACDEAPRRETLRGDTTPRRETLRGDTIRRARDFRPGIRFNPATLRPGTRVGELVADSVAADTRSIDSTSFGVARFRGQIELSGWTLGHSDPDSRAICFEADSASAARLPRWLGDERRPWFCFVNRDAAARALGPPSEGVYATVVIERFTIHRGGSDEVNSAAFVRLVRGGPTSASMAAHCYRSSHSVLLGPPRRSGQDGKGPGWLRLEGISDADSGRGGLVDANRSSLGATWRRASGDSVSVLAAGHHLRVELRLAISDSAAVGAALARSDAAAEPDASGRLRDLRREWVLTASRAPCDSMPANWTIGPGPGGA
jgi:hypothetical protein